MDRESFEVQRVSDKITLSEAYSQPECGYRSVYVPQSDLSDEV